MSLSCCSCHGCPLIYRMCCVGRSIVTINTPCFSPCRVLYCFQPPCKGHQASRQLEIRLFSQTRSPICLSISLASSSLMGVTILITLRWISAVHVSCSFIEHHFFSHSSASCFLCWKKGWKLIGLVWCVKLSPPWTRRWDQTKPHHPFGGIIRKLSSPTWVSSQHPGSNLTNQT